MTSNMYAFQELAQTFVHNPRVKFALLHSSSGGCMYFSLEKICYQRMISKRFTLYIESPETAEPGSAP